MTTEHVPMDASRPAPLLAGPEELPRVILIDDDTDMLAMLRVVVGRKCDCEIRVAESGAIAWELFKTWRPDIIVTDIKMPDLNGLDLLNKVKKLDPSISVIMMTGYGTVEMAVDALKQGAYDFIEKPFDNDHLVLTIQRCLERIKLLHENQTLQQKIDSQSASRNFIGQSPKLKQVLELMGKIADTDVTVLIRGESGTGKELAARVLHQMSGRSDKAIVAVNCPALPEHILESELFGYAKGAFTGATSKKKGLFLEADGSTILLDEIGDLPIELQTKLLRVLQEKEIMPLGHTRPIKVDVRVLASTNQDLEEKIRQGLFREDLYYRLNVVSVIMPSLNDMTEDIPLLARHFLQLYGEEYGKPDLKITPAAMQHLERRRWKGNVRELQNVVKRAVLLAADANISIADLKDTGRPETPCEDILSDVNNLSYNNAKEEVVNIFSRKYLTNALQQSGGNVSAAARSSGLGRQSFQRLLRRYGLEAADYRTTSV